MKEARDYFIENMAGLKDFMDDDEYQFYKDVAIICMKEYAKQACEDLRERIAENATTRTNDESTSIIVDKDSILNTKIILP